MNNCEFHYNWFLFRTFILWSLLKSLPLQAHVRILECMCVPRHLGMSLLQLPTNIHLSTFPSQAAWLSSKGSSHSEQCSGNRRFLTEHHLHHCTLHWVLANLLQCWMETGLHAHCSWDAQARLHPLQHCRRAQMKLYCNPESVFRLRDRNSSLLLLVKIHIFCMPCNPLPMFLDKMFCL